MDENKIENHEK